MKAEFESGQYYHLFNHANGSDKVFRNDGNYEFFIDRFKFYISPIAETYCYCLMPNHFHILIRIKDDFDELISSGDAKKRSQPFSNFFNSYSKAFNKQQKRMGSLFTQNFNRVRIEDEFQLKNTVVYVHMNPVKHGFCSLPEQWKHSSYHVFLSENETWIRRADVFSVFDGKDNFLAMHDRYSY